jgi:two-component system OmpR family response regulator
MYRVAVVDDDARMRRSIVRGLRAEELSVPLETGTGRDFLNQVEAAEPDVVVLDIGLPDCDGRDLCLALRARGLDTPVLFLTARQATGDLVLGFNAGADDYLPKPFAFAEFLVRVSALGRRHVRSRPHEQEQKLRLDPVGHCAAGRARCR